jgi:putative ABC transport system ATP-binding protein
MNSTGTPLIRIEKLNITFHEGQTNEVRALDNINLQIYPHEYLILFGPSGCGKSTLLNVITGLLRPTNGSVEIEGKDITSFSEKEKLEYHRRRIGMIFQAYFLVPTLSIIDNVCLPRAFSGGDIATRLRDGMGLLHRFNIETQADKFPSDLSGGQRQRVAIARSLINSPSIIIADEPVGNLDSKSTYNVLSILRELNEVDKKLVILVTHDPNHLSYGDRVVHMRDGKITKIVEVINKRKPMSDDFLREQEEIKKQWGAFKAGKLGKAWDLFKGGQLDKDWELVKKDELKKAFESFKEGKLGDEWKLGDEYELVRKEEIADMKREHLAPELETLMRSFKNLTPDQVGTLLIPFKAQQVFSHVFFHMPELQIENAKKIFQDYIAGGISSEELEKRLEQKEEEGGAGWDSYHAKRLINGIVEIYDRVRKIDYSDLDKSTEDLAQYLIDKFKLKLGEMEKIKFLEYLKMRLGNELAMDELLDLVDRPVMKGGVGLNRRTAIKVAREVEIIMLARYSM